MTPDTLLLRQAHPNFIKEDWVTSQAFIPFPKDKGLLSVYDGDQITAAESHRHYTQVLGNQSHSVWAVTKAEADQESVTGRPDPLPDNPAHAAIDFSEVPQKTWRRIAKRLKMKAINRECAYLPEGQP